MKKSQNIMTKIVGLLRFCTWSFARDLNVYVKTAMHWFQFPQIQELTSSTFTSFIWQCYSFNVHSVLFIILLLILFACLNKDLSLWWIFSYLVSLIGGLESERFLTIFIDGNQIHTYMHTCKHISKEWKILFCRQGRLNYKSLNLLCTYTIWLFTAFAQNNTSNIQQIIRVKIQFSVMVSHLRFLTEKWNE